MDFEGNLVAGMFGCECAAEGAPSIPNSIQNNKHNNHHDTNSEHRGSDASVSHGNSGLNKGNPSRHHSNTDAASNAPNPAVPSAPPPSHLDSLNHPSHVRQSCRSEGYLDSLAVLTWNVTSQYTRSFSGSFNAGSAAGPGIISSLPEVDMDAHADPRDYKLEHYPYVVVRYADSHVVESSQWRERQQGMVSRPLRALARVCTS